MKLIYNITKYIYNDLFKEKKRYLKKINFKEFY